MLGFLKRALNHPKGYLAFQYLYGAHRLRRLCIDMMQVLSLIHI